MEHRDRATGWKCAKRSGHENEYLVKERLDTDPSFQKSFLKRICQPSSKILRTSIGGLHETSVPGVNGRKTKSKTDLKVYLDTNKVIKRELTDLSKSVSSLFMNNEKMLPFRCHIRHQTLENPVIPGFFGPLKLFPLLSAKPTLNDFVLEF